MLSSPGMRTLETTVLGRGAPIATLACLLALAFFASSGRAQVASLPDVLVTPGEGDARAFQSPQLAVDPTNQNRFAVAYHEAQRFEACYLARSDDGGKTWRNVRVVGAGTPYPMPENYKQCYDPMVSYDRDGTLFYEYQGYPGTNPLGQRKTFITASRGSAPFEAPKEIDPPQAGEADRTDLYSEMVVDQRSGRVYVSWARFCEPSTPGPVGLVECVPPGKFQVASSGDGARTFSEPVTVSQPSSPDPARGSIGVDGAGTVYAAWIDGFLTAGRSPGAPKPKLYAATSRDEGRSFGRHFQITETERCTGELCYSPDAGGGGFIHVVGGAPGQAFLVGWDRRGGDKNRVFFSQTDNGGESWSPPRVVGIPPGAQDHQQHHPRMAVDLQGRVHILYYDYSPDGFHQVYMIDSDDGGRTFSAPVKLSDVPSNARIGPYFHGAQEGENLANFGQRLGIATTLRGPLAAWTDSRRGDEVNAKLDIFFDRRLTGSAGGGGGSGREGLLDGCLSSAVNVTVGTAGNDTLTGTLAGDRIFAGTGNDRVDGLAGDDCIDLGPGRDIGEGGRGNDIVLGGLGPDMVSGSSGRDRLGGGAGNDRLFGGAGNDQVLAGPGRDRINGGFGNDRLHGQSQNDRLVGSRGRDSINGGRGNDRISGGSSRDAINGDAGNDRIDGGSSSDVLRGNSGKDLIIGRSGRDRISGGSGNDRISARDGRRDRISCGRGRDRVIADRLDRVSRDCERVRRR
ncbi:hypothetical protein BH20ACT20_BH20ACT20_08930 [soil metagenome]